MSRDLTIRLLGRPRVSVDGASGLQKLVRRYVVQGPRAAKAGITDTNNPLFLSIGTADEEFDTYLLINQSLEPSEGSMDKAYLTREYLEFKNTWSSESVSDGGEFKQISRKYAVLKAEHAFGYDTAEWGNHPSNNTSYSDPWSYIPNSIKISEPTDSDYGTGFSWTRKSASIVTSEAGLDVWQVSWFEPIRPTGRPSFSIDSSSSLNSLAREYHITDALADDLSSDTYATFAIGTEDSENTGYFLVDRQVRASNQTGISTLSVKYLEFNNKWSSESVSDGGEFKQVSRKYPVLKAEHAKGYGATEWSKHPANSVSDNDPWDYLPESIKSSEPTASSYGTGFTWTRKSASIVTSEAGLDVWQVSWIEPIRPTGRPAFSVDSSSSLNSLVRQYHITKAVADDLNSSVYTSSFAIGNADSENSGYFLVSKDIKPSNQTDISLLTVKYLEFKNTWISESVSDSGQFKQLSRRYPVLKAQHNLGYSADEWAKHPDNATIQYEPWDFLPKAIQDSEPTDSTYGTGFAWTRKSASLVTSENGLDVWQVSWIEPLRPTGRPAYSLDGTTRLSSIVRSYHVTKELADNLSSDLYASDYAVGTADPENPAYYLVDLQVKPSTQVDLSLLTAKYLKLTAAPISESFTENVDLVRVRKRFAVLRNDHASVGYGSSWSSHPSQGGSFANAWNYAPQNAKTNPSSITYDYDALVGYEYTPDGETVPEDSWEPVILLYDKPGEEDPYSEVRLSNFLRDNAYGAGDWLQGAASVSRAGTGMDIWTLEWVTHAKPYWTVGTVSAKSGASNARRVISFDEFGAKIEDEGGTVTGEFLTKAETFISFEVAKKPSDSWTNIKGGSYTSSANASVFVDLFIEDHEGKSWAVKQSFKNAVWQSSTAGTISFDNGLGESVDVANYGYKQYTFGYDGTTTDGSTPDVDTLPIFQSKPIQKIGGRISWTRSTLSPTTTTGRRSNTSTSITPIFSGSGEKIWKIATTYVGRR
jgi:hypothetical protein